MRKGLLRVLAIAFCLSACAALVQAQATTPLTPEIVETLKSVGSAVVSPDGAWIAYTVNVPRTIDEASGPGYVELWMLPTAGGEARLFIGGKNRLGALAWSPDGKLICFTANRGVGTQVYALPLAGGEAYPLTKSKTGINGWKFSADGTKIAYVATDDWSDGQQKERAAGRDMIVVETDFRFARLHVVDIASGEDRTVTPAEYQVWEFDWSPDGTHFVITASDEATTDASYMFKKLWLVSAADGSRKPLCETAGKLVDPAWSPGGAFIAWAGAVDISDPYQGSLFVCPAGGGAAKNLTGAAEETISSVSWLDDNTLACTAIVGEEVILFTIETDGSGRRQILTSAGNAVLGHPSFAPGGLFAAPGNTARHPNELFSGDLSGKIAKRTDLNPHLREYAFGEQSVISYAATDGTRINGVLIFPVGYEKGKRYPLIVQPHGGPEGAYLNGWITSSSQWSQMLAGQGYFVFAPNYRGSIGRGVAFSKADHNDLGGKEFQDVIDGVDWLIAQGYVDGNRVGSGGGSYGGYFSALAATKASERFAAAVVFAGITNWFSNQGTADIPLENALVHWNIPDWWAHPETMWKASPLAFMHKANTPTLIAHGERDQRVPLGQGQELFRCLKNKGVPVEMVIYPRAGHGLGESQHRLDYARRVLAWFDRWVKNRPVVTR